MEKIMLESLQREFIRSVTSEESLPARGVLPGGRLSARAALEVYRTGYVVRLTEALGETYEAVWSALGDEAFFRLCRDYIRRHPSTSYNLSDYGQDFPAFLGRQPETEQAPYLEELARFERVFKELFHAAEHRHAQRADLARLGSGCRLRFGSAVRLLSFQSPVYALWRARGGRAPRPEELAAGPERLLLYKLNGEIYARVLDGAEFAVLSALFGGAGVESALEAAAAACPDLTPERVSELFRLLWESGVISDIEEASKQ